MSTPTTALGFRFNAQTVAPSGAFDPIPGADYNVYLTGGSVEVKSPGNKRINLEWTVQDGTYKGRKIFDGLNVENANSPENARISNAQLSGICHAVQVYDFEDISALFNRAHVIKVDVEPERYVNSENQAVAADCPGAKKYDARNRFKGAKFNDPNKAGGIAVAAGTSTAGPTPPWGASLAVAAPATPAATVKPGKPGKPGKPAAGVAGAPARMFYVGIDGPQYEKAIDEATIASWLTAGMPATTALSLDGSGEWKDAAGYGIAAAASTVIAQPAAQPLPPVAPAAPAGPIPPWGR